MSRLKTSDQTLQLLGGLTTEQFFDQYWQKKPLLIRQAIPNFSSLISADELAGLSLEDQVQARIIVEHGKQKPWQVSYSPLDESIYSELPETHWTLLVSDVEKHLPEFTQITDQFRFIPDWRIDDLMISYAPAGGSVGPHLDQYDVFLLQAEGQRHWHISDHVIEDENFIDGLDIRVLEEFNADQDWVLNPGDMLYLPPKFAHHGIAVNDCLTYSIGFRANSHEELATAYTDNLINKIDHTLRYNAIDFQEHAGEITRDSIAQLNTILSNALTIDTASIEEWFGQFITEQKIEVDTFNEHPDLTTEDLFDFFQSTESLTKHPAIRFAFIKKAVDALLFINGEKYNSNLELAQLLCDQRTLDCALLSAVIKTTQEKDIIVDCINLGYLY